MNVQRLNRALDIIEKAESNCFPQNPRKNEWWDGLGRFHPLMYAANVLEAENPEYKADLRSDGPWMRLSITCGIEDLRWTRKIVNAYWRCKTRLGGRLAVALEIQRLLEKWA